MGNTLDTIETTTINLKVVMPKSLASQAQEAGLLDSEGLVQLLDEAIRKLYQKKFGDLMDRLETVEPSPMTMEEIQAEVEAVRHECH